VRVEVDDAGDSIMTEAELWHLQLLAVDNSIGGAAMLLTMISGDLAVAYFVAMYLRAR
jgi:hypothetical protein